MNLDKCISIRVRTLLNLPIGELREFQNDLKSLDKDAFETLKQSLKENAIQSAFSVWNNNGVWCILDGHQRRLALLALQNEGWFVPPIPCDEVLADTYEDAKKSVLIQAARYGKITQESLADYAIDSNINLDFIQSYLRLADIRVNDLGLEQVGDGNFINDVLGNNLNMSTSAGEAPGKVNEGASNNFFGENNRFDGDPSIRFVKLAFTVEEYPVFETDSNKVMELLNIANVKDLFVHLVNQELAKHADVETTESEPAATA